MRLDQLGEMLPIPSLRERVAEVERRMDRAVTIENPFLAEPARRVADAGGKRLRPILALAAASLVDAELDEGVFEAAAAVELVHVGSLVHDDIMDSADTRRGVPTVNAKEGADHALLVGDFLLARAAQMASTVNTAVSYELATAIVDLCDGQSRETAACFDAARSRAQYEASIAGKTAALFRSALRIGALAADPENPLTEALGRYGHAFGMAFQIVDDVLDLVSTEAAMGKPVGNDIREGVYTLPLLLLLADDPSRAATLQRGVDSGTVAALVSAMDEGGFIAAALAAARGYNDAAVAELVAVGDGDVASGLCKLPTAYLEWAVREKTESRYSFPAS